MYNFIIKSIQKTIFKCYKMQLFKKLSMFLLIFLCVEHIDYLCIIKDKVKYMRGLCNH